MCIADFSPLFAYVVLLNLTPHTATTLHIIVLFFGDHFFSAYCAILVMTLILIMRISPIMRLWRKLFLQNKNYVHVGIYISTKVLQ